MNTLFDPDAGTQLRDQAIDRAESAAPDEWSEAALTVVHDLSLHRPWFTTDHVWERIEEAEPPEPRAMGAVMRHAAREGWVRATPQHVLTDRPKAHRRPIRV